jgi:hypothetical protein
MMTLLYTSNFKVLSLRTYTKNPTQTTFILHSISNRLVYSNLLIKSAIKLLIKSAIKLHDRVY